MSRPELPLAQDPGDGATTGHPLFGYQQELHRGVGSFASFAAGFSFVSILTTVFQLFGLGFGLGGAAFFWTWPLVFAGQLLVALCFAELAARWPISGAIYQWSSRLAGTTTGWFVGWIMIIGQILTVAAAAIAAQAVLPGMWSGFQIVGGPGADPSVGSPTGAQNAVLLGCVLLVITTVVNILGIRQMAAATSFGVTVEIMGVLALVLILFFLPERGPRVVAHPTGWAGHGGYFGAFLASSLMAAYVMVGFDSAGELAEETHSPRRTTPRTILRALITSGVGGALLILSGLMAARSLTDGKLAAGGLSWVLTDRLGGVLGRLLLCCVAVAVFACTLAVQTSGARMMYSMAREGALPFHRRLGKVSARTGTPITTSVVVGVGAALALVVNIRQSAVFTALSSLCIALLYLAYLGVTVPLLVTRIRRRGSGGLPAGVDETGRPLFSLGRWGVTVNTLAVLYQAGMTVNLIWPRAEIYDLTGGTWWLRWSAPLFIGLSLAAGAGYFLARRLHRRIELRHVPHTHTEPPLDAQAVAEPA
ncbi:amino acid/polyamine/organocation transporter (APC superfamily) [Streptomyces puniciscabiei]|uniref:Amino acid/polyamine/organocation transporter (APC superfamily) n=1 Tax=Streptomyces puniciscabiei TaxID=164348 RepID=A0A542U810_9ACTN|nr:amino acid permease [Streptomyces puniciscabiei]TQK95222.1 amino acid/polyamine/organocation transporter (APC superfamily) [Streptomyces puniciscabiei]